MTTEQIAHRFVELIRTGQNLVALDELFADNARSLEDPSVSEGKEARGKEAIRKKNQDWFADVTETHGSSVSEPLITPTHFTCIIDYDVTLKSSGHVLLNEIGVYEVKDGKIVAEHYFYHWNPVGK